VAQVDGAQSLASSHGMASPVALRGQAPAERALMMFGGDRDRIVSFVRGELGPIESIGGRAERLLRTLEIFLEHGQRIANASAVSGQHRDTVHRHLREVEELLERRVEERSAELLWALRLRRALLDSGYLA